MSVTFSIGSRVAADLDRPETFLNLANRNAAALPHDEATINRAPLAFPTSSAGLRRQSFSLTSSTPSGRTRMPSAWPTTSF